MRRATWAAIILATLVLFMSFPMSLADLIGSAIGMYLTAYVVISWAPHKIWAWHQREVDAVADTPDAEPVE